MYYPQLQPTVFLPNHFNIYYSESSETGGKIRICWKIPKIRKYRNHPTFSTPKCAYTFRNKSVSNHCPS